MCQFSKVLLAFDNAHTVPRRALDCRPGLGGSMIALPLISKMICATLFLASKIQEEIPPNRRTGIHIW